MNLRNGGIRMSARIDDVRVNVRLIGDVSNSGSIDVSRIDIAADLAVGLGPNGQLQVSVVPGSQLVVIGGLDANFSGFVGSIVNLAFSAFENSIRGTFASALESFLVGELDAVLSGALSGLDISAFDVGIPLPGSDDPAERIAVGRSHDERNRPKTQNGDWDGRIWSNRAGCRQCRCSNVWLVQHPKCLAGYLGLGDSPGWSIRSSIVFGGWKL